MGREGEGGGGLPAACCGEGAPVLRMMRAAAPLSGRSGSCLVRSLPGVFQLYLVFQKLSGGTHRFIQDFLFPSYILFIQNKIKSAAHNC